jgi:hypothetical protein
LAHSRCSVYHGYEVWVFARPLNVPRIM